MACSIYFTSQESKETRQYPSSVPSLCIYEWDGTEDGNGIDGFHSIFSLGNWRHYIAMLPADWLISTSHDTFALQFLW